MTEKPKPPTYAKPPTYVPAPRVPTTMQARYEVVMRVLAGAMTVSEAARTLGMSRNHFQTLLHKSQAAMLEALKPKPGGRPPTPHEVVELREQVSQLTRENQKLRTRVETIDRLLGIASDLVTGRVPMRRPAKARSSPTPQTSASVAKSTEMSPGEMSTDEEPDPARLLLRLEETMRRIGISGVIRALLLDRASSTLRRWRSQGMPENLQRAELPLAPEVREHAETLLRDLRGSIGAAALGKAIGVSRRRAAALKAELLTRWETERKKEATRVEVAEPGLIRGFDAMELSDGYILVSTDAAVPYRTALLGTTRYDAAAVASGLSADFETNGAPLVLRLDNARQHKAPEVREVLDRHGVLALHGPPHHPQYYGQLERQNREHRAWLRGLSPEETWSSLGAMRRALNERLPRRRLGWRTAAQAWALRSNLRIDRQQFRQEVETRTRRAAEEHPELNEEATRRLAIHRVLMDHEVLKLRAGAKC